MNNIDCSDTINWNAGAGFYPIGDSPYFSGSLNGHNYNITGLYNVRKLSSRQPHSLYGLQGSIVPPTGGAVS
jgi:hypothetical protein